MVGDWGGVENGERRLRIRGMRKRKENKREKGESFPWKCKGKKKVKTGKSVDTLIYPQNWSGTTVNLAVSVASCHSLHWNSPISPLSLFLSLFLYLTTCMLAREAGPQLQHPFAKCAPSIHFVMWCIYTPINSLLVFPFLSWGPSQANLNFMWLYIFFIFFLFSSTPSQYYSGAQPDIGLLVPPLQIPVPMKSSTSVSVRKREGNRWNKRCMGIRW